MADYDAILAPVDKKWGRPVTLKDWAALEHKHVADLTDDDLLICEAFGGRASRYAKETARDRWTKPIPPTVPVETKTAAPVSATVVDSADDDLTWKEFVVKHANAPMTLAHVDGIVQPLIEHMKASNEKNKTRNQRLDTLEQRVKEQDARILELEANHAVAHVRR